MCYSDYNDIKYLNVFDETKAVYFNGYWRDDFIYKINSKEELIQSLKDMPQKIRFNLRKTVDLH